MKLQRILQLLFTSFLGQTISVVTQLLVPPFFLHYYGAGLEVYGEWIALSASVNYLGTLNYGVQTYANNQMTILYNGGDVEGAKALQASALRLLLVIMAAFTVLGLTVFCLPVAGMLKLRHVSSGAASLTLYLLILQIAMQIALSLLANSYMVVGRLHRGNYWQSAQRLAAVLATALMVAMRSSFPVLAGAQLITWVLFYILTFLDVRRTAPMLLPSLRHGSWGQVLSLLKPSGHFGLIAVAGFLTWQMPVILIQYVLGPAAVGVFALVRVVFQMSRQLLSIASVTISQDITLLVGKKDWKQLLRLYDLSERVVLFLVPIITVGSLLMCPFLFSVWLHKRSLYDPALCILMAIVSAVLGIKEHKTQFQSSSNQHEKMSIFILVGYSVMLVVAAFAMKPFGLVGFMTAWLVWETIQTAYVLHLNVALFPAGMPISMRPVLHLTVFMSIAFALSAVPAYLEKNWSLPAVVLTAVAMSGCLGLISYWLFDVDELRRLLQQRVQRRLSQVA